MRRAGLPQLRSRALQLRGDAEGATIIEFAFAFPVLLLLLMGVLDIGQSVYVSALLRGAVQQVARDATVETYDTADLDAYVTSIISGVAPGATVNVTRKSYYDYADVERPETWNDANNNNICDNGEGYTDENGNGRWDADIGSEGNGGANDVVLFDVHVSYKPLFPVPFTDKLGGTRELSATALKKNQPFALQEGYGSSAGTCK